MSALRNFVITLFLSLLVFGLLAYGLVTLSFSAFDIGQGGEDGVTTAPPPSTGETTGTDDTIVPGDFWDTVKGSSFNALLVGTDYEPSFYDDYESSGSTESSGEASGSTEGGDETTGLPEVDENGFPKEPRAIETDAIILVRVNKDTGEVIYTSIPANTGVTIDGLPSKLENLYAEKGIDALCQKVQSLTGLPIDFYAVISIDSFKQFIDDIGGITYDVPQKMNLVDEEKGLYIDLKAGLQELDGKKALDMLRFDGYPDGDVSRRECAVNFIKALIKKLTVEENYVNSFVLYQNYSQYVETNFTMKNLGEYIDLIFSYEKMSEKSFTYPGTVTGEGDDAVFIPNTQKAIQFFSAYKFKG